MVEPRYNSTRIPLFQLYRDELPTMDTRTLIRGVTSTPDWERPG